ncbi:MAG: hypothetical protein JO366_18255 [Methylobacteriaceae bacterium]|nr:hypothetical protein [Methylobacteriaceae bacterium]
MGIVNEFAINRPVNNVSTATWTKILKVSPSPVSDILHARGLHRQVMRHDIQPLAPSMKLAGIARTMISQPLVGQPRAGQEYELLFKAIDGLGPGEILVTDKTDCCVWGELCSEAAMRRGGNGAVIDGFTRDAFEIRALGFPMFCRGRHMSDMLYHRTITGIDEPVISGDVAVWPGDLILGSDDGVVVVPAKEIDEVINIAFEKSMDESKVRKALREGMSASDAYKAFGVM